MQVTLDIKELLIGLVLLALFVLLIMLIVVLKNLIPSLKKLNLVLGDANRITTVAANKTEQLDGVIDEASSTVLSLADNIRGNGTLINKATSIGAGLASAKEIASRFRSDEDKEYLKRAKERKSDKAKNSSDK